MQQRILKETGGSSFLGQLSTVFSGAAAAQLLPFLTAPVVARLYAPEIFGEFGLFMAALAIVSSMSSLRYEQAIAMTSKEVATSLTQLSLALSFAASILSGIVVLAFAQLAPGVFHTNRPYVWAALFAASVFAMATAAAMQNFATACKRYRELSISYTARSLVVVGIQVAAADAGVYGLVAANLGGAIGSLAPFAKREHVVMLTRGTLPQLRRCAKDYLDFPLYNAPQSLLNSVSQNASVIILNTLGGPKVAGAYFMVGRVIQRPLDLVAQPLRTVFLRFASETHDKSAVEAHKLFRKTTVSLFAAAFLPACAFLLWGEQVLVAALGEEWKESGAVGRWLVPWLAIAFVNIPAVCMTRVCRLQKQALVYEGALFSVRTLALVAGCLMVTAIAGVAAFSAIGIVFNVGLILWVDRKLRHAGQGGPTVHGGRTVGGDGTPIDDV